MNVESQRENIIGWNQLEIADIPLEGVVGVIEYDNSQVLCVGSLIGVSTVLSVTNLPLNIRNTLLKFNKYPLNQKGQTSNGSQSMMPMGSPIVSYQQMPSANGYYIIVFQLVEPLGLQIGYLGTLSFKTISSYQTLNHDISEHNDSQLIIPFVPQAQYTFSDICDDLMIIPRIDLNVKFEFLGLPVITRDPDMGAVIIGLIVKASHTQFQAITLRPRNINFLQDCLEGKQSRFSGYEEDRVSNQIDRLTWKEIHEPDNNFNNNNGSAHNDGIYSVCRLNFCTIATSSVDKTLSIWQEGESKTHNNLQYSIQIEGCCRDLTSLQSGVMLGTNENKVLLMEYNSQYQLEVLGGVTCKHKLYSLLILSKQHRILAGDCYGNITAIRYELPQKSFQNGYFSESNHQQILSIESWIQSSSSSGDTTENITNTRVTPELSDGCDDYGHKGSVNAMHSPLDMNLKVFFSGGEFGEIKMWNTENLQFIGQFYGHQTQKSVYFLETIAKNNSKSSLSSLPLKQSSSGLSSTRQCGFQLVSGGSDRTVRIWDIDTFSQLRQIDLSNPLYAAAKINQYELIFGQDNQLQILDIEQGTLAQPQGGIAHQARINAVCKLSATSFASADIQGSLRIWQIKEQQDLKDRSGQQQDKMRNASWMHKNNDSNCPGSSSGDYLQGYNDDIVVNGDNQNGPTVRQIKPRPRVLTAGFLNNSRQTNPQQNNQNSVESNAKPSDNSRFNDKSPLSYKRLSDIAVAIPVNSAKVVSPQINSNNNNNNSNNNNSSSSCTPKAISKQQTYNQVPYSFSQPQPQPAVETSTAAITPPKRIVNKLSNLSSSSNKSSFTDRPANNNSVIANSKPSFTDRPVEYYDNKDISNSNLNNEALGRGGLIQNNQQLLIPAHTITPDTNNKQFCFPQDTADKLSQLKTTIPTTTTAAGLIASPVSANDIPQNNNNTYPNYNSRQSLSSYMASNAGISSSSYEGLLKQFDENDKYQVIYSRKICNSTSSHSLSPYASSKAQGQGSQQQQQYSSNYNSKKYPQGNTAATTTRHSNYDQQQLLGNTKEHLEIKTTSDTLDYSKDLGNNNNNQLDMYSQKSTTNTLQTLSSPNEEQSRIRILSQHQQSQPQQFPLMNSKQQQQQQMQIELGTQMHGDYKNNSCCAEYRAQISKLEQENSELREKLKDSKSHNVKYQSQIKQLLKSLEQSEAEREENLEQLKIIAPELKKYAEIAQDFTQKNQQQAAVIRAQQAYIEQLQSSQAEKISQIVEENKTNHKGDKNNTTNIAGNQKQDALTDRQQQQQQQKLLNSDAVASVNSIQIDNNFDRHDKQSINESSLSKKPSAVNENKSLVHPNILPISSAKSPSPSRENHVLEQIPVSPQQPPSLSASREHPRNNQINTGTGTSNILLDSFGSSQQKGSCFINTGRSCQNSNKNNSVLMSREQVMMELRIAQEEALIIQKEIKHLKFKASICEDEEEILVLLDQLQRVNSKFEQANQQITELKSLYGFL